LRRTEWFERFRDDSGREIVCCQGRHRVSEWPVGKPLEGRLVHVLLVPSVVDEADGARQTESHFASQAGPADAACDLRVDCRRAVCRPEQRSLALRLRAGNRLDEAQQGVVVDTVCKRVFE
jgi:hypothetical protein